MTLQSAIPKARRNWIYSQINFLKSAIPTFPYVNTHARWNSDINDDNGYEKCWEILDIPKDSDQETVRSAFLKLVKIYHPDSGSQQANKDKFNQIESAYRKLQRIFSSKRRNVNECSGEYGLYYKDKTEKELEGDDIDIQHTAPQHRQYLNYDGYGSGTPQQRHKQYQKMRAVTAVQNIYKHRLSKLSQGQEKSPSKAVKEKVNKIKLRSEIDRLVEDLILEAIARGDFDNLRGTGKPLPSQIVNPYVDFVTQKMNQVLIENGFTPGWITLQKEIGHNIQELKKQLAKEREKLGPLPLSQDESHTWNSVLAKYKPVVVQLNKKIASYNLQVPILEKQMMLFRLEHEMHRILKTGKTKLDVTSTKDEKKEEAESFFKFLQKFLKRS